MAVRDFPPLPDDGGGLDFGEFWGDPTLVAAALWQLSVFLQPAICYCLRLRPVHAGDSWFEPYGDTGLVTDPTVQIFPRIPHSWLLVDRAGAEEWPVLAEWLPSGVSPWLSPKLAGAVWHGQIRLKSGRDYVGFFMGAVAGHPAPHDDQVRDAYRRVRMWLDAQLPDRCENAARTSSSRQEALRSTHCLIEDDVNAGRPRVGLQRFATLVTSHLGTGFNRIACLARTSEGVLTCVHAHGGDCGEKWSAQVQFPLANEVRTMEQLQGRVGLRIPPFDDPLYCDLADRHPLSLATVSSSDHLIANIWRRGGTLEWLPKDNAIEGDLIMGERTSGGAVRIAPMYNIAARFDLADPWLAEWRSQHPDSALFRSKNGTIFAFAWSFERRLLALVLLDLGFWNEFRLRLDVVPRLKSAKLMLDEFAYHFKAGFG